MKYNSPCFIGLHKWSYKGKDKRTCLICKRNEERVPLESMVIDKKWYQFWL